MPPVPDVEAPHLSLRVAPIELGAHAAMPWAFRLMESAAFMPLVYLESETSSAFLEWTVLDLTGRHCTDGGTIAGADCRSGNRAVRGWRRP